MIRIKRSRVLRKDDIMADDEIMQKIMMALENCNVFIDESDDYGLELKDYFIDSIVFISFIVELENAFGIEIDMDMLNIENFKDLSTVHKLISCRL